MEIKFVKNNKESLEIDSQGLGISAVESVLGVDHCGYAALLLRLGDGVDGERGLSAGLGSIDLDDSTLRDSSKAKCNIKAK